VEDVGATPDLFQGNVRRLREIAGRDQAREALRAGDVGPLADHDEVAVGTDGQRFETGKLGVFVRDSGFGIRDSRFGVRYSFPVFFESRVPSPESRQRAWSETVNRR